MPDEVWGLLAFGVFVAIVCLFAWHKNKENEREFEEQRARELEDYKFEIQVNVPALDEKELDEVKLPKTKPLSQQADPTQRTYFNDDLWGPEKDAWEIPSTVLTYKKPYDEKLLFNYVDRDGSKSRRTAHFIEYQFYGGHYLYGQCELRRAGRTFNCEKMDDIINVETGEVIDNLVDHIVEFTKNSPYSLVEQAFEKYEPICKSWYYIAAGTKRMSKADYEELCLGLNKLMETDLIEKKHLQSVLKWAEPPSSGAFEKSVGGVVRRFKDKIELFEDICLAMHKRHARPNFAEKAAMEFIEKRIAKG